jgi:chemotaxis-related protein WspD
VYHSAAPLLLDRAATVADTTTRPDESPIPQLAARHGAESILVFRVGAEWLGLRSRWIKEIVDERKIHTLPQQRNPAVLGIVNIRGALVLCMSLAALLNVDEATEEEQVRHRHLFKPMVVTTQGEHVTVFPVDEVHGVHRFSPSELAPVPSTIGQTAAMYTRGILPWREKTVGVLDGDSLYHAINRSIA